MPGEEAEIEIRQIFEAEDFGPRFAEEKAKRLASIRAASQPELRHEVAEKVATEMGGPVEKAISVRMPQSRRKI
jgi:hypothetical protein